MTSPLSATATNWREGRRLRAWELHEQGWRQSQIAAALGVTSGAVCQWMRRARDGGGPDALRQRKAPGGQPRLSAAQQSQVLAWLREGAEAHGFRGNLWTRKRVAVLIERKLVSSRACEQASPELEVERTEAGTTRAPTRRGGD